uniref:HTH CENPB-type domain-containing protein n=1 Tax=Timema monikensis TaxID=170555 RepID=A0A7R9HTE6_9NEOP|nr:unnamed protein product [Timema monikensis]
MRPPKQELPVLSCHGLRNEYSVIDRDLWVWYCALNSAGGKRGSKTLLQERARWAFHRAGITHFKASDGWYRRWIHRWKKYALLHGEEEGSNVTYSTTTSDKQVAIVDRMKILHDVASQQLSPEILKSQNRIRGHTDCGTVTALETHIETTCSKSVVNSSPNYNTGKKVLSQCETNECELLPNNVSFLSGTAPKSLLKKLQQDPINPNTNTITNTLVTSSPEKCVFSTNSFSSYSFNQNLQEANISNSSENSKLINHLCESNIPSEQSLDIMDYLTLHISENCESSQKDSQFEANDGCMAHSNMMDSIFNTSNCDSVDSFLSYPDLNELHQQQQLHFGLSQQLPNIDHLSNLHFQQESHMNNVAFTSDQQMVADQMRGSSSLLTQIQNISTNSTLNSYEFLKFSVPIKKESAIDFVEIAGANTMPDHLSETSQDVASSIFREVGFTLPADANHNASTKMTLSSKVHGLLPLKQHSDLAKKHVEKQIPNSTSPRKIVNKKKKVSLSSHLKTPLHKKGERYLPQFKEKVLAYAANHTFKETARKFRVNNETVSAWKKDKISAQIFEMVDGSLSRGAELVGVARYSASESWFYPVHLITTYPYLELVLSSPPHHTLSLSGAGSIQSTFITPYPYLELVPSSPPHHTLFLSGAGSIQSTSSHPIPIWRWFYPVCDGVGRVVSKQVDNTPVVTPLDDQFVLWLRRCRQKNRDVDHEEVRDKARQLVAQCGVEKEAQKHCRWFIMWVRRFNKRPYEDGMELWSSSNEKEYHIQYPHSFKMEIAAFAERHSQILAAKVFNVTRKRVFEWLKTFRKKGENAEERKDVASESKGVAGRSVTNSEVDHQIWAWYQAHEQTKRPTSKEIRSKACELYRAHGHPDIKCSYGWYKKWSDRFQVVRRHEHDDKMLEWVLTQMEQGRTLNHGDLQAQAVLLNKNSQFKASPGWALRFCKRHPELLRHRPTLETELPSELLHKVELFRFNVQKLIREKAIPLAAVGNMDELHLNFTISLPGSGTNWKRHLVLRRPDMDNCHATVVLACLADGNMLPPMLILKGNLDASPDFESFEVSVTYQKDAQMDLTTMETWLERIWFNLLIADCYEPHGVTNITDIFRARGCHCAVIPGGCTSRLQPLDITIKKEFQDVIEKQWNSFNSISNGSWDTQNKLQLPGQREIIDWVSTAYRHVQTNQQIEGVMWLTQSLISDFYTRANSSSFVSHGAVWTPLQTHWVYNQEPLDL